MTALAAIESALRSRDPEDRRQAAARLGELAGEALVPLLMRALGDEDWRVRKEATAASIALAPSSDVLRGLVEALSPGDNVGLRNAAVEALAGYGAPAVDALSSSLPMLDADGRKLAVEALGRTGVPMALLVLRPLLWDHDPNVRAATAESIALLGTTSLDTAVPLLEQCLDADDQLVQLAALDGLNGLNIALRWDRLRQLLSVPVLERSALLAAGRSGHVDAAPLLVAALERGHGGASFRHAVQALSQFSAVSPLSRDAARRSLRDLSPRARERVLSQAAGASDDLELRRAALLLTGVMPFPEAAEVAADALSDDSVAGTAEQALSMHGARAVPALVARARAGFGSERAICIELLGQLADESNAGSALAAVRAALADGSLEVVGSALGALTQIGDEECLELAAEWLCADTTVSVRTAAAAALAALAKRHPTRARTLVRNIGSEGPEAQVVAVVLTALGEPVRGSLEEDVAFLSQALSNDNPHVRRTALDAFAALACSLGVEAVGFALTDEELEVQLAAVRALGRMRSDDGSIAGLQNLFDLIARGEDDTLVAAAIQALGQAGDPRALTVLKPLVRSDTAVHAVAAVEALGNIADPRRVEALTGALAHADPEVVKAALRVLAQERDPRVPTHVGACLDHEAWDVRRLAADLLGDIGAATDLLRAKLSIEPEPLVKDAVQRALGEVDSVGGVRRTPPPPLGSWRPR
ncbi:MAG TPA: HEAT repeat domain-containing protein [Polyangiaceae bacterium]